MCCWCGRTVDGGGRGRGTRRPRARRAGADGLGVARRDGGRLGDATRHQPLAGATDREPGRGGGVAGASATCSAASQPASTSVDCQPEPPSELSQLDRSVPKIEPLSSVSCSTWTSPSRAEREPAVRSAAGCGAAARTATRGLVAGAAGGRRRAEAGRLGSTAGRPPRGGPARAPCGRRAPRRGPEPARDARSGR